MAALAIQSEGLYIDGTFGRGGHTRALLTRLGPKGRVLALDRDPEAIAAAQALAHRDKRLQVFHRPFSHLAQLAENLGIRGAVAGVLLDLGVSSPQLEDPKRGFSFSRSGPLDMRMDPEDGESAAQWLARAPEAEIARVLRTYGEERFARRIARRIVQARRKAPLTTTDQLADLVAAAVPRQAKHPATRTFQALRIQINGELDELRRGLAAACDLLKAGGRLVVISFHSLEDRIVKRFIRAEAQGLSFPPGVPVPATAQQGKLRPLGKRRPSAAEIAENPRARSAILRVAERR